MEFWKFAAITTWAILGLIILIYLFLKRKWIWLGINIIFGQRLHTSINQLFEEIAEKKVKKDTLANTSKHILWRFTRIGVFAILAAIIPSFFLIIQTFLLNNQNRLLQNQNRRIDQQTNLLEADRRSSLVFLMSNILDKVDDEIKEQRVQNKGLNNDSVKYSLSKPLVNRIIALSRAFQPYRLMQGDTLSNLVSPERGQLFIALMGNNLDSVTQNTIVQNGDFSYSKVGRVNLENSYLIDANLNNSDFSYANFSGSYLSGANLSNSTLIGSRLNNVKALESNFNKANLEGAKLQNSDFSKSNLGQTNFKHADISNSELYYVNLLNSNLYLTNLQGSNLSKARLVGANLYFANLSRAQLDSAFLSKDFNADIWGHITFAAIDAKVKGKGFEDASLYRTNLSYVDFGDTIFVNLSQLRNIQTFYGSINLDTTIEKALRKEFPCLFTKESLGLISCGR
jgi:uncharacterized protein YjbI with pentapeptide repeats